MAIKIGGTSIIDDNKNITNVGIVTIGIGGTTGKVHVGTGATIDGAGNAYFGGDITVVGRIVQPSGLSSFYPSGSRLIDQGILASWKPARLELEFSRNVGIATTGTIDLRLNTVTGTILHSAGISSVVYKAGSLREIRVSFGGTNGSGITTNTHSADTYFPVIPCGMFTFTDTGCPYIGNNNGCTGADTYTFTWRGPALGEAYCGGYLICQAGGTRWIIAPKAADIDTKSWYAAGGAVGSANAISPCGDWFLPSCTNAVNPYACCKQYWDCVCSTAYWTNTPQEPYWAWYVDMPSCTLQRGLKTGNHGQANPTGIRARAFRCVNY